MDMSPSPSDPHDERAASLTTLQLKLPEAQAGAESRQPAT